MSRLALILVVVLLGLGIILLYPDKSTHKPQAVCIMPFNNGYRVSDCQ